MKKNFPNQHTVVSKIYFNVKDSKVPKYINSRVGYPVSPNEGDIRTYTYICSFGQKGIWKE